jgi:hypothetical protein
VRSELGYGSVQVSGPFGIAARVRVTVYPADPAGSADGPGGEHGDPRVVDITLRPCWPQDREFGIVDFSREVRYYPPNSEYSRNGLQYDCIAITPEMGISDVLAIVGKPELAPAGVPVHRQ